MIAAGHPHAVEVGLASVITNFSGTVRTERSPTSTSIILSGSGLEDVADVAVLLVLVILTRVWAWT